MARDPSDLSLLDQHVVLAVIRLQPEAYGVSIFREIEKETNRRPSLAGIYNSLGRLSKLGLFKTTEGEATKERGGKAKLYFSITADGRRVIEKSLKSTDALRHGLEERFA